MRGHALLHFEAVLAEGGQRAGRAAQHGHEGPPFEAAQPLRMAGQLVDPDRDLGAECGRHGMLAVGAARKSGVGPAVRKLGHRTERAADLSQQHPMHLAQQQQVARLHDVLRRGAPMHVFAGIALAQFRELPDERHQLMRRAPEPFRQAVAVDELELRLGRNLFRRRLRDHAEVGFRESQRRLHIEPGLPSGLDMEERADARIGNAHVGRIDGRGHAWAPSFSRAGRCARLARAASAGKAAEA